MRSIRQPGPAAPARAAIVPAGAVPIETMLPAGMRLLDAVAALMTGGVESLCLHLHGGGFGPFGYVIPALSDVPERAAFYSATFRPPGVSMLDTAAITVGWRGAEPFFHCHGLWTEADGRIGCGHVLPDETVIAAPIHAVGIGLHGARFAVTPDPETGFSLFIPAATTPPPAHLAPALALRLAPNQDLCLALEGIGAGFGTAAVHGGVASTIEARFTDAAPITNFATELFVRTGRVVPGATAIDIGIVDLTGAIGGGRLVRGDNPVLMTFEGALTPE